MTTDQVEKQVDSEQKQDSTPGVQADKFAKALAEVGKGEGTEVSGDADTEVSGDAEVKSEQDDFETKFQEKWNTEYANLQKTVIQPLANERDTLRRENADLHEKVQAKEDDADLRIIRTGYEDENGEDEAEKYTQALRRVLPRVRTFEQKEAEVKKNTEYLQQVRELEEKLKVDSIQKLGETLVGIQRYQNATKDVIGIFMSQLSDPMKKAIERLNTATTPEHYNDILESIKSTAAKPKQTKSQTIPDSSKAGGGGGIRLKGDEAFLAGLRESEKKK